MPTGVELIEEERERQIVELAYDAEHDREHVSEELAFAAACYAAPTSIFLMKVDEIPGRRGRVEWVEPWPSHWGKPERSEPQDIDERLRELAKAGALIAAEIDRLQVAHGLTDDDLGA